jgi:hypothetical protein
VKASSLRPIAARWQIASALLLFALAGQAFGQATISGTVTAPLPAGTVFSQLGPAFVVATNDDTWEIFTANPSDVDGTYSIGPVDNGTYKVVAIAAGFAAPAVTNLVIDDNNQTPTADFAMALPTPFPIVKSANPIPLTEGIDSASFQDAPEIDLNSGENVEPQNGGGTGSTWGGPSTVSGRLKVKYSSLGLHIAADVTYLTPLVNNQTGNSIWNGNAFELYGFQNDPYDPTRTTYDPDHDWQVILSLGANTDWWIYGGIQAHPSINGNDEPVDSHVMIQEKSPDTGEQFRLDIPWAILLDSTGNGISMPNDNDLGALDLALDASDPNAPDPTTAARKFQLSWSGLADSYRFPYELVPVQFVNLQP